MRTVQLLAVILVLAASCALGDPQSGTLVEGYSKLIDATTKEGSSAVSYRGDLVPSFAVTPAGGTAQIVKWETAPVPDPVPSQVTFAFTGSLGRAEGKMELLLGEKVIVPVSIQNEIHADQQWAEGPHTLRFDLKQIRNGRQGVFYVTVPGSELEAGKPAVLTMRSVPGSGTRRCAFALQGYPDTLDYRNCNLTISAKGVFHRQSDLLKVYVQPLMDFRASDDPREITCDLLDSQGKVMRTAHLVFPPKFHSGTVEEAMGMVTDALPDGDYALDVKVGDGFAHKREAIRFVGDAYEKAKAGETARERKLRSRLSGMLGDYDREPRKADKRLDIPALIEHLKEIHANAYDFLVWHQPTDWEDLQAFLPEARKARINVLVTLVPPVYDPAPTPYKNDYLAWAKAIAELSLKHPNLFAWAIDDFHASNGLFTPEYVASMTGISRKINPDLGFFPVIYSGTIRAKPEWIHDFGPSIDGMMYVLGLNAEAAADMEAELTDARLYLGPNKLLMVNVYGMATSGHPEAPRLLYFQEALRLSRELADGIRIYCLPKEKDDPLKRIAGESFGKWAGHGR